MRLRRQRRVPPEMDLIPMINIIFVLLIFFMVAGRLSARDPVVISPPASQSERKTELATATVFVAGDGAIFVGQAPVTLDTLGAAVAGPTMDTAGRPAADSPGARPPLLHVKADANADATLVVNVLHALRDAGVERVRLLTQVRAQ